nr:LCP family protein [Ardenticatenales bacterium]
MSALLAILLIGGLLGGVFVYYSIRTFVARSQLPIFPAATSTLPAEFPILEQPGAPEGTNPPPENNGVVTRPRESDVPPPAATERLTVLVMGIDRRETEEGSWRTDSMILISIDPRTESVAMLSVPRDLFVTMPDYGYGEHLDRINKAFFFGDSEKYPGGGPALARQTIRRNFGIKVDRYIVMDFDGFRRIIDHLGGIDVKVPELLIDNDYPTEDYGYMQVRFEPGRQHMDGERALIYSRTR